MVGIYLDFSREDAMRCLWMYWTH